MAETVVDQRTLNRTLLQRQLLLERVDRPALEVIGHLVGMQAQEPMDPYIALWSRIDGFRPTELGALLEARQAVRCNTLWRTTIHLLPADDAPLARRLTQPLVERTFRTTQFGRNVADLDEAELTQEGRRLLADRPMTGPELGQALAERWPEHDPHSLSQAVRWLLPTVQIPPRAVWGRTGPPTLAALESWVGQSLPTNVQADGMIVRYLRAFGPASTADARSWSGLGGLREVFGRLDGHLRRYRDDQGRLLFDLDDAQLADRDLPAPPRFFGNYDNLFLAHSERSRIVPMAARESTSFPFGTGGTWVGSFTLDGFAAGAWRVDRAGDRATLRLRPVGQPSPVQRVELEAEGHRLLDLVAPHVHHGITWEMSSG